MPYYYYGYDPYLILLLPALIISIWAQFKVKHSFSKYSKIPSRITGAEAARRVLEQNGVYGVSIERVAGNLTDHYDPKTNTIRLSQSVYDEASIAAVGVAAHEAGHAVQYAQGYTPIKIRSAILPVCQLGSQASMPLFLLGIIFSYYFLVQLGIILFCGVLVFQLITLPVEFNASSRAISAVRESGIFVDEGEIKGIRKVLSAAAMTYVAALIVSVAQLLRLLALSRRRR